MKNKSTSSPPNVRSSGVAGCLSVVATPIGNLSDMTHRAVEVLRAANAIACEDTRTSRVLCQHYHITTPLLAYHEHNATSALPGLLARLAAGEHLALISDAGTPLISDPGYRLVRAARDAGVRVEPIPGACSVMAALSAGGLPTDRFHFAGFLPPKQSARTRALEEMAALPATLVLLESCHRLPDMLADAAQALCTEREAVVAREMTKRFEEFRRGTLGELAAHYGACESVKGEMVVLIAPPPEAQSDASAPLPMPAQRMLAALAPHYPPREVASLLADAFAISRNAAYAAVQAYKQGQA